MHTECFSTKEVLNMLKIIAIIEVLQSGLKITHVAMLLAKSAYQKRKKSFAVNISVDRGKKHDHKTRLLEIS